MTVLRHSQKTKQNKSSNKPNERTNERKNKKTGTDSLAVTGCVM